MTKIALELLMLFVLVLINGLLAMSEIAMVSARKSRLKELADFGNPQAKKTLKLLEEPNWFLSTIQVGITLIGICAGVFSGATLGNELDQVLEQNPLLEPYSEPLSYGIVIIGVTYISLIVGELVPKQLAISNAESIAMKMAGFLDVLSKILKPAVWILSGSTEIIINLMGLSKRDLPPVTEEEIKILIEQGTKAGVFEEGEQDLLESVFRFADRKSGHLMVPRSEMTWLNVEDPLEVNLGKITEENYSRYPVCNGNLDEVIGIVRVKDVWKSVRRNKKVNFEELARPALFVVEHMSSLQLLEKIKETGNHPALVIDEYGVIKGLVSLNDLVNSIMGEIPHSDEPVELRAEQQPDGTWLMDGLLSMDEFCEILNLESLSGLEPERYQTLGGFFVSHYDEIPNPGSEILVDNIRFKVTEMDGKRIDELMVEILSPSEDEEVENNFE